MNQNNNKRDQFKNEPLILETTDLKTQEDNVDFASLQMGEQAKKNNKKNWSSKPDTKEKSKKMRNLKMASIEHRPNLLIYKEIHIKC